MARGGKRTGAGRPKGSGKYGEPTRAVRLPISRITQLEALLDRPQKLPLYLHPVAAGLPTLAEDAIDEWINLHDHLLRHPQDSFLVPVAGDSMTGAGIYSGDLLIVDRAIAPTSGKIVVAVIEGELTVKTIAITDSGVVLQPQNPDYPAIAIHPDANFAILGVVTHAIHTV